MELKKTKKDLVCGIILALFSALFFSQTFSIRKTSLISISSALFPQISAVILAAASLVLIIKSAKKLHDAKMKRTPSGKIWRSPSFPGNRPFT